MIDAHSADADKISGLARFSFVVGYQQPTLNERSIESTDIETLAPDDIDALAAMEAQIDDLKDQLLRQRAEFDNYRKRTAREVERFRKTATESVIHDILPVLDNLELALAHTDGPTSPIAEGVGMVIKQLLEVLGSMPVSIHSCGAQAGGLMLVVRTNFRFGFFDRA